VAVEDSVLGIHPINADSGEPAFATQNVVSALRNGAKVNGVLVVVTSSGCRIFKPATNKGASKTWDEFICYSAGVVKTEGHGYSLVGVFGDGNARAYSIPGLKEIGCTSINTTLDLQRLSDTVISSSGDVLGWAGPSEIAVFNVWGAGTPLYVDISMLFLSFRLEGKS
jgi:hypothetical protein